jgi:tRNA-specific 2-thiouridylase
MRVLVAMSGGVDSSVAAALLAEEGHEVIGVTLKQWAEGRSSTAGYCAAADAEDARRVAGILGIRHRVLDYAEEFRTEVVDRFAAEYLAGRTPNPCIECNRRVRFGSLLERTAELRCDALATGHHARIRRGRDGFRLLRAADAAKDQSYALYMLGQDQLDRIRFPVGEMTKARVREEAARRGLRIAAKPESQDLCFLASDPRTFLRGRYPETARPGPVVDPSGRVLGEHSGTAGYTVGQRRGLGVAVGEPRYVIDIVPESGTLVVGARGDLRSDGCRVGGMSFVAGRHPEVGELEAKVRYHSEPVAARLEPAGGGEWDVWFAEPVDAVAPGQAAVFYRGDEVIGGGTILAPRRR